MKNQLLFAGVLMAILFSGGCNPYEEMMEDLYVKKARNKMGKYMYVGRHGKIERHYTVSEIYVSKMKPKKESIQVIGKSGKGGRSFLDYQKQFEQAMETQKNVTNTIFQKDTIGVICCDDPPPCGKLHFDWGIPIEDLPGTHKEVPEIDKKIKLRKVRVTIVNDMFNVLDFVDGTIIKGKVSFGGKVIGSTLVFYDFHAGNPKCKSGNYTMSIRLKDRLTNDVIQLKFNQEFEL